MNLDPRSIPYRAIEKSIQVAGISLVTLVASSDGRVLSPAILGIAVLGTGLVLVWQAVYVSRYEYRVTPDTFDIQSGVFSRREREIPFGRIQNVDIAQNVFQRLLNIAELRLETAGGGETEAALKYVSQQEATRLQDLISDRKRDRETHTESGTEEGETLFALDLRELLLLGATSANFRLPSFLIVGLSVVGSPVAASELSPRAGLLLLLGPAVAVAVLLGLWLLSGLQAVFKYYSFRLTRYEEELRYRRGLLQRYNGTIPLSKIQTLMIRENVLARRLGYGSLLVETAGYAPGQEQDSVESAIPIAKRQRVLELARSIEPFGEISFERPPKRARTRYVARYTILVVVFTGLLGGVHLLTDRLPFWYLGVLAWLLVPVGSHLKWRQLGYHVGEEYVITQSGFWTRRTTVVPYHRVQTVSDSQTIFQRRRGLATLVVDTATSGGFWGGDAVALDIDVETARTLRDTVHRRFRRALRKRRQSRAKTDTARSSTEL